VSEPQIEFAYPVDWPTAKPRTPAALRKDALWRHQGSPVSFDVAVGRLREQVRAVTPNRKPWRMLELTLSTNYELRADGRPRRNAGAPADPAVAFFFELDGKPHVLACDRWSTIPDNIAAIAAHIDALRGQERWGVADLAQAFAGHAALPPPDPWWKVLGVARDAPIEAITRAWRGLAREHHPDAGGSRAEWDRLNAAYEQAQAERR